MNRGSVRGNSTRVAHARTARSESGHATRMDGLRGLVGYSIRKADIVMHQHFARTLAKQRIRPAEYGALMLIRSNPGITQTDIADALSVQRPNLVGLIGRLEQRGLIKRDVYEPDRRNHVLSITAKGKSLLARVVRRVEEQDREITQCWSESERRRLLDLLQRLYERAPAERR